MNTPDSVDKKLLKLLGQDAQQNSESLARQLKLSAATVRRRLRNLVKSGTLRVVGVADPVKLGFPLAAVIGLDVAQDKLESAIKIITERPEVTWISATTGRYDVIVLARFASTLSLSDFLTKFLARIDGLKNSETFICFDVGRERFVPIESIPL